MRVSITIQSLFKHLFRKESQACLPLEQRQLVIGLGAMKSGTTWLSDYLQSHPEFFHSPIKEMRVFSDIYRENPFYPGFVYQPWDDYKLFRMQQLVLGFEDLSLRHPRDREKIRCFDERRALRFDRLKALAQLGSIKSVDDYLAYFSERIGPQLHFGEISPAYSHLPPEAFCVMARITADVRFLFVMRDPTSRAASHIRHLRRRIQQRDGLDERVSSVCPGDPVYICSDYAYTIQSLRSLGLEDRCRYLIYEDLFSQGTVDGLCDWLGLARHEAVFDRRLNAGVGQSLTAPQMALLRDSLAPIYDQLRDDPAVEHASSWLW